MLHIAIFWNEYQYVDFLITRPTKRRFFGIVETENGNYFCFSTPLTVFLVYSKKFLKHVDSLGG